MWQGRIAWVHAGQSAGTLSQRLQHALDLDGRDLEQFLAECRIAKRPLGEHLIDSGLLDAGAFRRLMWEHNAAHFASLRRATMPVGLPLALDETNLRYDGRFTYSLDELMAVLPTDDANADVHLDRSWVFDASFETHGRVPPAELRGIARWFVDSGEHELIDRREGLPALVMVRAGETVLAVECGDQSFARTLLRLRRVAQVITTSDTPPPRPMTGAAAIH